MNQKLIEFNKSQRTKQMPDLQPGDVVRVHKKIKEGDKERIQVFQGLVIAIKGKQSSSPMITVRRESQGVGVEITIPLYLPTIEKIEVLRHSKVRRAKLYYMRKRSGKSAKMKVREITKEKEEITEVAEVEEEKVEASNEPVAEEVKAEEVAEAKKEETQKEPEEEGKK